MVSLLAMAALLMGGDERGDSIDELRAAIASDTQDKAGRIRELLDKAEAESKKGNGAAAERYLAEAYSLRAEMLYDQGDKTGAERAFGEARARGWTGAPPWQGKTPAVQPKPTEKPPQDRPQPQPQPQPVKRKPRTGGQPDYWAASQMSPLKTSNNGGFNSLMGLPPFEEAIGIPEETWDARLWIEIQTTDWSDDSSGGPSNYKADMHEESFEFNYGLTNQWVLGGRLTMGELLQTGSDPIRVFQNGAQIVPTADRGFAFSELVLRSKYLFETKFANLGILGEIKVPLANDKAFVTSKTIDIALIFLLTKRFSEKFALHLNLGPVIPIGSADLFEPGEDANVCFMLQTGMAYKFSERLVALLQFQGNTSPWSSVDGLGDFTARVTAGGRFKLNDALWIQGGSGFGINELSGGLMFTGSIDLAF